MKLVERLGCPAVHVESGLKALQYVRQEVPGLVLLDWTTSQVSGLDVPRTLRDAGRLKPAPGGGTLGAGEQGLVRKGDFERAFTRVQEYMRPQTN